MSFSFLCFSILIPIFLPDFTHVLLGKTETWDTVHYTALLAILHFVFGMHEDLPESSIMGMGLGWGLNAVLSHGTLDAFRHSFYIW